MFSSLHSRSSRLAPLPCQLIVRRSNHLGHMSSPHHGRPSHHCHRDKETEDRETITTHIPASNPVVTFPLRDRQLTLGNLLPFRCTIDLPDSVTCSHHSQEYVMMIHYCPYKVMLTYYFLTTPLTLARPGGLIFLTSTKLTGVTPSLHQVIYLQMKTQIFQ